MEDAPKVETNLRQMERNELLHESKDVAEALEVEVDFQEVKLDELEVLEANGFKGLEANGLEVREGDGLEARESMEKK